MSRTASKTISTNGAVSATEGTLYGAHLAAGSDAATLTLYDNTNQASGTVLLKLAAPTNGNDAFTLCVDFATGCYAAITGTGPSATILYGP